MKGSKSKSIQIDKSINGKEKILLEVSYLDNHFNVSPNRKNAAAAAVAPDDKNLLKVIEVLQQELLEKNKQIELILQGQYELLQSLGKASEIKQIDNGKTKRKWYKLWLR